MKLSIFTLNVWGLKYPFAKNRTERIKALAVCLISNGYDVVCLQELWFDNDYEYLKKSCENEFKYIHYFHSGMLGSGMCIMSRYPIIDVHYHSFLLNGYLHMVWHGDWFGGKGIGLCRINVKGFIVDVYTTHLHACYNPSNDKYIKHRVIQAFETANFIRITSMGSDLAVLAGDLNSEPTDLCFKLISLGANLKDCYSNCLTNSIEYTFNHTRNSYENSREIRQRIDYVMFKFNEKNLVTVEEHRYSLPSCVPGKNFSYSDHEPIEAVFEITANKLNFEKTNEANEDNQAGIELQKIVKDSLEICNEELSNSLISIWHPYQVFLLIFVFVVDYFISGHFNISTLLIVVFFLIYNYVNNRVEQNCIRGFCHQMATLFFDFEEL